MLILGRDNLFMLTPKPGSAPAHQLLIMRSPLQDQINSMGIYVTQHFSSKSQPMLEYPGLGTDSEDGSYDSSALVARDVLPHQDP